jgi:hypothetical protein
MTPPHNLDAPIPVRTGRMDRDVNEPGETYARMGNMNMRRATFLIAGLLAGAVLPHDVLAQLPGMGAPARRLVRIGFGGGVSVPTNDVKSALDNGINGQAYLLIDTGILPAFRFNLGYQKFDFKEAILGGGATSGQSTILSGIGGMTVDLFRFGPVRPYVTAGLGAFHIKDDLDAGTTTPDGTTSSTTRFGIDGGAGLALRLGRLEGFIEARLQNVYTEAGLIDTRTITAIPVTFGVLF